MRRYSNAGTEVMVQWENKFASVAMEQRDSRAVRKCGNSVGGTVRH
jgi:hypothetical protein